MGFQLKDFVSITASMINYAKATQDNITDFSVGGVARTMMEAPAIEIEELYQRIFAGIMEAIPTSIYRAFDFDIQEARPARGVVRVEFITPLTSRMVIPAGTVFASAITDVQYVSEAEAVGEVGFNFIEVPVTASSSGSSGNVPAGGITEVRNLMLPPGATITNDPLTSGKDEESDSERKVRFRDFILSLARGTLDAVRFAASCGIVKDVDGVVIERVARIGISEDAGRVRIYVYGTSGLPSAALLADSQRIVDGYYLEDGTRVPGYRTTGVRVDVLPMVERGVDIDLRIRMMPGFDLTPDEQNNIRSLVFAVLDEVPSGGALYVGKMTDALLGLDSVREAFVTNTENVLCASNEVLRVGQLQITEFDA